MFIINHQLQKEQIQHVVKIILNKFLQLKMIMIQMEMKFLF
jgi:hypothetical protein